MVLMVENVVNHQEEEEEEPEKMSPDVDSLIVEPQNTPDTAEIIQGLPVPSGDSFFLCIVRNLSNI